MFLQLAFIAISIAAPVFANISTYNYYLLKNAVTIGASWKIREINIYSDAGCTLPISSGFDVRTYSYWSGELGGPHSPDKAHDGNMSTYWQNFPVSQSWTIGENPAQLIIRTTESVQCVRVSQFPECPTLNLLNPNLTLQPSGTVVQGSNTLQVDPNLTLQPSGTVAQASNTLQLGPSNQNTIISQNTANAGTNIYLTTEPELGHSTVACDTVNVSETIWDSMGEPQADSYNGAASFLLWDTVAITCQTEFVHPDGTSSNEPCQTTAPTSAPTMTETLPPSPNDPTSAPSPNNINGPTITNDPGSNAPLNTPSGGNAPDSSPETRDDSQDGGVVININFAGLFKGLTV